MIIVVVIAGVILGAVSFFAAKIINDRKEHQVNATVRIADGVTEDEIAVVTTDVIKKGHAEKVIFTKSDYTVDTVRFPDGSLVHFTGCNLAGIYDPEKCHTTSATQYWVTLTEVR